jgi:bifunctional UDP-N-acetylglucosamine pyrophosphorylase/glucosamine-1-phosphate N-acetyltransferase
MITEGNDLHEIVEAKDATPQQLDITLCNGGIYAIELAAARQLLCGLEISNDAAEYYLTDIVGLARRRGRSCGFIKADQTELAGANDPIELAHLEMLFARRKHDAATSAKAA